MNSYRFPIFMSAFCKIVLTIVVLLSISGFNIWYSFFAFDTLHKFNELMIKLQERRPLSSSIYSYAFD